MSSLLFYNIEKSKNKEKTEKVGVSKLLTGTVDDPLQLFVIIL